MHALRSGVVVATISRDGQAGRGEATGVYYRSENAAAMVAQIEAARAHIESGVDRETLRRVMPAGGAHNAIDCALWDLEACLSGTPAWKIAGLNPPVPLVTTFTLGARIVLGWFIWVPGSWYTVHRLGWGDLGAVGWLILYLALLAGALYLRFRSGAWRRIRLTDPLESPAPGEPVPAIPAGEQDRVAVP